MARPNTPLQKLEALLAPDAPLPRLNGDWAIDAALAYALARYVHDLRPQRVVEFGSGVSTVILSLALRRFGGGLLVSCEDDPVYAEHTRILLDAAGIRGGVDLRRVPLRRVQLPGGLWYDTELSSTVDLVFVDGPRGDGSDLARYPAMSQVYRLLAPDGAVILHDTNRPDEQAIASAWLVDYPDLHATPISCAHGATMFTLNR